MEFINTLLQFVLRSRKLTQKAEKGIISTLSRKLLLSLSRIPIKEYSRENNTSGDNNEHFRLAFKSCMFKE
jgi:hypothetical protein